MPDTTSNGDGGLSKPARKRRTELGASPGVANGVEEPAGGKPEPIERTENASERAAFPLIDPLDIPIDAGSGSDSGSADQPRRRGRRPGGKNKPRAEAQEAVQNLSSLLKIEKILVSSAFFLSNIASAPELIMEPEQAKDIREAIEELARLYPIGISEKKIAWTNFIFAVGGWAGPGLIAVYKRPPKPKPVIVPQPIRSKPEASASPGMVNGLASPAAGEASPASAKTPSQLWNQSGDIEDTD